MSGKPAPDATHQDFGAALADFWDSANLEFTEALYAQFLADPLSVQPHWRIWFADT